MHRKEHLADLSLVLRRSQPGTLARSRVASDARSPLLLVSAVLGTAGRQRVAPRAREGGTTSLDRRVPERFVLLDGWLTSGAKQPPDGIQTGTRLPLADSLDHETRDGLATARLIERSSRSGTAGARSVADALAGSEICRPTNAVVGDARFPQGVAASRRVRSSCTFDPALRERYLGAARNRCGALPG